LNKFGVNPALDADVAEDIWDGGGDYGFYPTSAQSMEILSTDADDTGAGNGARTIWIQGLGSDWCLQSETITMDGLTEVNLANTYIRMFRMIVMTAGDTESNEGTITCRIQGGGTTGAIILPGKGQTLMAIYTVPVCHTALLFAYSFSALGSVNGDIECEGFTRLQNGGDGAWNVKTSIGIKAAGTSNVNVLFPLPQAFPAKTDLRGRSTASANNMSCSSTFDLLIIRDGA
jgi:hypothetical protein